MSRFLLFAFWLALAVCVSAWKAPLIKKETAIMKLEREGHLSVAKSLKIKHHKPPTRSSRLDSGKQKIGWSKSYNAYSYTMPVGIGSPAQQFNVYVDITSGDFWVAHVSCESMGGNCDDGCYSSCHSFGCMGCCGRKETPCDMKHKFNDASSSTFVNLGGDWEPYIDAEDTPIHGFYAQDTVAIGRSISIPQTNVQLATFADGGIIDSSLVDGIIGLAFKARSTGNTTSVMENAVAQKVLDQPLFTVFLDSDPQIDQIGGQISFGELDDDNCQNDKITYFPLFQKSYWIIAVDAIYLNGKPYTTERKVTVSYDLNQPEIVMSYTDLDKLINQLGATFNFHENAYTVDCSTKFTWGISKDSGSVLTQDQLLTKKAKDGTCILPFNSDWENGGEYILGEPWMRNFCSVFDLGNQQVGHAPVKK